ncbi:hypothetical protein FHB87_22805 [Escherichia coli]|nr:IS1 family transposase [Escherichia coli]MBW9329471.1 hypothetical protein [Escherichia coli]
MASVSISCPSCSATDGVVRTADVNHFTQTAGSVEEKNPEIQG